jgi:hypothetical protein
MDAEPFPIAYGALQPGTPVQTSDGREFGTVAAVLVDEPVDVFDGINVETSAGTRFVDADQVDPDLHHLRDHDPVLGPDREPARPR